MCNIQISFEVQKQLSLWGEVRELLVELKFNPIMCDQCIESPISLFNVNLKLYAKMLANHISSLLPFLINLDQVGFVLRLEARDTIKAINLHHNPGLFVH